jgi:hypothetical protein
MLISDIKKNLRKRAPKTDILKTVFEKSSSAETWIFETPFFVVHFSEMFLQI